MTVKNSIKSISEAKTYDDKIVATRIAAKREPQKLTNLLKMMIRKDGQKN